MVEYSEEERAQIMEVIDEQLELVKLRRKLTLPNELAPAVVFDPRVDGAAPPEGIEVRAARRDSAELPETDEDIAFAPLWQLGAWLRDGKISSTRLTELYLERLERYGQGLHCVATLTKERALASAAKADRELAAGRIRGPLHGIPYGAKDLFDTGGIATGWGAEPYRERVPERDAAVIAALQDAGAVLVAKLSLGALAYGDIWYEGRTRNPWNREEGSSGSSAGSAAAVAAGLVGFALGTETLGSITSPSLRCGVTGLRPTFGQVSRTGAMALCWSLDKIGPIARAAEDTALVLGALLRADGAGDPGARPGGLSYDGARDVAGRRVGYVPAWIEGSAPDRQVLEALRELGAELVELEWPALPYGALLPILFAEAAAAFEELTLTDRDDELAWQAPEAWPNTFRAARFLSAVDVIQAQRFRRQVMGAMAELTAGVDAFVAPAGASDALIASNFTGHPSLTLRTGFADSATRSGFQSLPQQGSPSHRVPQGTSLIGPLYAEGPLVELGAALETTLKVWDERPPLDEP